MATGNLFVYHLPDNAEDAMLYRLFSPFGAILSVQIIRDRQTGQCKGNSFCLLLLNTIGYGFVQMENPANAAVAMQKLNGTPLGNKNIAVTWKK